MSRRIEAGHKVRLYFNSQAGHSRAWLDGEVISMPANTGDLLYIKDTDNCVHGFNTNSSSFDSIMLTCETPHNES